LNGVYYYNCICCNSGDACTTSSTTLYSPLPYGDCTGSPACITPSLTPVAISVNSPSIAGLHQPETNLQGSGLTRYLPLLTSAGLRVKKSRRRASSTTKAQTRKRLIA